MSIANTQVRWQPTVNAGIGTRIGMFILDAFFIAIIAHSIRYLLQYFIAVQYGEYVLYGDDSDMTYILIYAADYPFVYIAAGFAYHVVLEQSTLHGSIAKYILGYRVYSSNGLDLKWWQSLLRNASKYFILFGPLLIEFIDDDFIPFAYVLVLIICLIVINTSLDKKSLNDFGAGTLVAK